MKSQIIDGKKLAEAIKLEIRQDIVQNKLEPELAVILIGDNPASHLYVRMKEAACHAVGIIFHKYFFPADAGLQEINDCIDWLNNDVSIDAILIQLPLPDGLDENKIISRLDPAKDVDGFHPENIKLLLAGKPRLIPGLPLGVLKLLDTTEEKLTDKTTLIIANSTIFAQPMAALLKSKTKNVQIIKPDNAGLTEQCLQADILITAVGRLNFIDQTKIKPGAIIIDVGINKTAAGKTVGDVNFEQAQEIAAWITPVPGGVGPVTVAMLLFNTVCLSKAKH